MSRTFLRRELRRQAPAGLGMLLLSWLMFIGTLAFSQGYHMEAIAGFCFLLVPSLLGVYAFGPDLELGQERFLTVLPMSRAKLGALRLGTATGIALAVDLLLVASYAAVGQDFSSRVWQNVFQLLGVSLLLLPLGALAAITFRHTLAALGAVLGVIVLTPVLLDPLEDLYMRLDEVLVPGLLIGWGAATLWLYARARSTPPLRVAVPLGAAALLLGFLPAPAYGAFRFLTRDDSYNYYGRNVGLIPAPKGKALAVLRDEPRAAGFQAVGVLLEGAERPLQVGYGDATWRGDWLVAGDGWGSQRVYVFDLASNTRRVYDAALTQVEALASHSEPVRATSNFALTHYDNALSGLHVDRVGDDLWVVPVLNRSGGAAPDFLLEYSARVELEGAGYCATNLTQGTSWTPPRGYLITALVDGWALLRNAASEIRLVHVVSGAEFAPATDLPVAQRTPSIQLVRVVDRPMLFGLTKQGTVWCRDLNAPAQAQLAQISDRFQRSGVYARIQVISTPGPYVTLNYPSADGEHRLFTWHLDGESPLVECDDFPDLWGPRAGDQARLEPGTERPLVVLRADRPQVRVDLTEFLLRKSTLAWNADGEVLVVNYEDEIQRVNAKGELEPGLWIPLPELWDEATTEARR